MQALDNSDYHVAETNKSVHRYERLVGCQVAQVLLTSDSEENLYCDKCMAINYMTTVTETVLS